MKISGQKPKSILMILVVVSGSRCRGLENDNSDIDVVVEIKGSELKEDALFNIFHEEGMEIDGITVDINPVRTS